MGVLVNYLFEKLTADEVRLIGAGLDLLPHGKVGALAIKLQQQVFVQEKAVAEAAKAAEAQRLEEWRASERAKLKAESKPRNRKGR